MIQVVGGEPLSTERQGSDEPSPFVLFLLLAIILFMIRGGHGRSAFIAGALLNGLRNRGGGGGFGGRGGGFGGGGASGGW